MANKPDGQPNHTLSDLLPEGSIEWLIDSAPDGFLIVDRGGNILFVNTPAENLFGYAENELLGQAIETLVPEVSREKHERYRADFIASPRRRPMGLGLELSGRRKDGSEFPVEISLSPVTTDNGLLIIAIIRDVTDYKRERHISETFQKALLSPLPDDLVGLRMASVYRPAYSGTLVGGDFFDVLRLERGLIGIALGDVSGKGIGAAVHTALAKYSFRAYAYVDPDPAYVMERLNRAVYRQFEVDTFITFFYGLLDVERGTMRCANAGHMPPLHLVCPDEQVTEVTINGMPLGVLPEARYEQQDLDFGSGDKLLLYSDGVTDARKDDGPFFGMSNLIDYFREGGCEPPDEFVSRLARRLEEWSEGHLQDDVTMLLVARD